MSTRIYSKHHIQQMVDNAVGKAYEKRERSIDFFLLFPVSDIEKEAISDLLQDNHLILNIRWRFGTVMFTAYIKD